MPKVPAEVILEQYQLRSTFFSESLLRDGYLEFQRKIETKSGDHRRTFDWSIRNNLGISEVAWRRIKTANIEPLLVFAHPNLIRVDGAYVRYYRCIAAIPQKGLKSITGLSSLAEIENGTRDFPESKLNIVIKCINEFVSAIIQLNPKFNSQQLQALLYSTAGTSIDGSWRNKIGSEGERVIRSILLSGFEEQGEISFISNKSDSSFTYREWLQKIGSLQDSVSIIKSVTLKNGASMIFSSEPDVKFCLGTGEIVGAIEIKAGIDPAGALERLGAMLKSFENVSSTYPSAIRILVASCITDEVRMRLTEANSVNHTFITTDIINNRRDTAKKLVSLSRRIVGLVGSSNNQFH